MEAEGKAGLVTVSDGGTSPIRLARNASTVVAQGQGRFYEAVSRGNVYYIASGAVAGTAFTGGAGGTPLVGIYNPTGSGKNFALLAASIGITAVPTAAGVVNPELWAGVSALPTGTQTQATNMLTQQTTGSASRCFVNTAMTSSTAVTLAGTLSTFWWATAAAGSQTANGFFDLGGLIVAGPGVLLALGLRTIPTSTTVSFSTYWEEITA